jgi:hypothetical protein
MNVVMCTVQLQGQKPTEMLAQTLLTLLERSKKLLADSVRHPLQPVRRSAAHLWPLLMVAVSSLVPLHLDPAQDASLKTSLKEELLATVQQLYVDAADAVTAACRAGEGADVDMQQPDDPEASVIQGKETMHWDSRIGTATAVTTQLTHARLLMPGVHELTLVSLPWALKAQALQSAQLQGLTITIRGLIVQLKNYIFEAKDVPLVLDAGLRALKSAAWQERGAALSLLQCVWFRCVCIS